MKTIVRLGISEFALPVPRLGSIELHSGYGRGAQDGMEIHSTVQAKRLAEDNRFLAEVAISREFDSGDYTFHVSGRIDGFFPTDPPVIEEIKSSFNVYELEKKLSKDPVHPYCLQLLTYGYFYWLNHEILPTLRFCLVSSRTGSTHELPLPLDIPAYEAWLALRLEELTQEAIASDKLTRRRKKLATDLTFPFTNPRPHQNALMESIEKGMQEGKRMLIQAPTGLGKTMGVLFPVLRDALDKGQRVLYVTPKNSQHAVAEDAAEKLHEAGASIRSMTITAKSKICFKNEPLCNPDYCEYAKDHYTKLHEGRLLELLGKKRKLTLKAFRSMAEAYQVCPFELQMESAKQADLVICDYNYVFSPRAAFTDVGASAVGQEGKPNLVIDEAHNLFTRAMSYYSPELSTMVLESMRPAIRDLPDRFRSEAEILLNDCVVTVIACRPEGAKNSVEIDPPVDLFLAQDELLRGFLSRYLEADIDIQPRDVVLRLCFYWSEFTDALGFVGLPKRDEFFTTFRPDRSGGGTVKITCCDASEMLKTAYDQYEHVVGFSATLKPFNYYAELSGLEPNDLKLSEFSSPFPKGNRKLLIIPEISTKYSSRSRNYQKIADAISRISAVKPGNYFAFFPSFDFLERVLERFSAAPGFTAIRQLRDMKAKDINEVIDHLKSGRSPSVVFAVQGGVFSEGVDYPGDTIIGAFIVGPPLPPFELEREKLRAYYDEFYTSGFDYAYSYPAMAKAIQAAGRVIRSETDRGLIVLMDNRFLSESYTRSMPSDWFETNAQELVSTTILKDVSDFWSSSP